jgi:hypothetical protein
MTQNADNVWNEGKFLPLFTGGVENAAPQHADIPRTGGGGFDLPSDEAL